MASVDDQRAPGGSIGCFVVTMVMSSLLTLTFPRGVILFCIVTSSVSPETSVACCVVSHVNMGDFFELLIDVILLFELRLRRMMRDEDEDEEDEATRQTRVAKRLDEPLSSSYFV